MKNSLMPLLPVADVRKAQEYYRDVLGCTIDWNWEDKYGAVSREDFTVLFSKESKPGKGTCWCISVPEVDNLCKSLRSAGANVVAAPETKPWGMREFTIQDNNGHLFRIFSAA
jgi:uncharacterized glyoxalase superfamily protein PhnB